MAIAPIPFPNEQALSAFSFGPLARLGQQGQQGPQLAAMPVANMPSVANTPTTTPSGSSGSNYARAISNIESGGKYDLLGPTTGSGDRAYGKYQIMGANIPTWTKEVFGRPMTTEQFLASPAAQDAVFNAKFGSYVDKYGPSGAAKAWFAGEGGMNNPNATDVLGTSVQDYAQRFERNLRGE
jgi:hypothetical protein